jgi:hypothetical protein
MLIASIYLFPKHFLESVLYSIASPTGCFASRFRASILIVQGILLLSREGHSRRFAHNGPNKRPFVEQMHSKDTFVSSVVKGIPLASLEVGLLLG